ncbi:hypothetical protein [Porphyromonas pogonae]|uniref:hypothetical protein n=1 Tax=Porphyromonas pogonae TaxID=867595 RepID=UPI002E76A7C7|nr:hypothetical protein [Porphyromonas pogonae]
MRKSTTLTMLVLLAILVSCNKSNDPVRPLPEIKFSSTPLNLKVGEIGNISLTGGDGEKYAISPKTSEFIEASIKENKLTVKALKEGSESLSISSGDKTAKITINVGIPITDIILTPSEVSIKEGEKATVELSGGDNKTYTIEPEKTDFATAAVSGKTLTITGVKAGTSNFTIKSGGKEKTIPVTVTASVVVQPKLAIEYIASGNLKADKKSFTTDHKGSDYFTWEVAKTLKNVTIDNKKYHLPTAEEWTGIFPRKSDVVNFNKQVTHKDILESITVHGQNKTYSADYSSNGKNITYALRFKKTGSFNSEKFPAASDNKMQCAYKYQFIRSGKNINKLEITVRFIGDKDIALDDISKEEYWSKNNEKDVKCTFDYAGVKEETFIGSTIDYSQMRYWTSTETKEGQYNRVLRVSFFDSTVVVESGSVGAYMNFSIRLFADE